MSVEERSWLKHNLKRDMLITDGRGRGVIAYLGRSREECKERKRSKQRLGQEHILRILIANRGVALVAFLSEEPQT